MNLNINKVIIGVLIIINLMMLLQLKRSGTEINLDDDSNLDISNKLIENYTVQLEIEDIQINSEIELLYNEKILKLQSLIEKKPRVVFWIPKNHCSECIIKEITYFNDFFVDFLDDVALILTSELKNTIFNTPERDVYLTLADSPISKWQIDNPVVFIIDNSFRLKNSFIIEPLTPLLTTRYYEIIKNKYLLTN